MLPIRSFAALPTSELAAEIAPRVLTPADVEARKRRLKSLIVLGKERGYLTFAEINDHLPDDVLDAEQIDWVGTSMGGLIGLALIGDDDYFGAAEGMDYSVRDDYDFVLIDCPPSLSMLTLNGLCAAHGVIVPMQCEYFALEGLSDLVNTIKQVHANLNPKLQIIGLLRVMFDPRITLQQQVSEQLKSHFGDKVFDDNGYTRLIPTDSFTVWSRHAVTDATSANLPGVFADGALLAERDVVLPTGFASGKRKASVSAWTLPIRPAPTIPILSLLFTSIPPVQA